MLYNFVSPDIMSLPPDNFIMTETIEHIQNYEPTTLKYDLSSQQGGDIEGRTKIKYIMTSKGPRILSLFSDEEVIDYNYYVDSVNQLLSVLNKLKNYQPQK